MIIYIKIDYCYINNVLIFKMRNCKNIYIWYKINLVFGVWFLLVWV